LLIIFKVPTKLFSDLYPAKFYILQQNHSFRDIIDILRSALLIGISIINSLRTI